MNRTNLGGAGEPVTALTDDGDVKHKLLDRDLCHANHQTRGSDQRREFYLGLGFWGEG